MIQSAEEFVRLRTSESRDDYARAAEEEAAIGVWLDVIERYPTMRKWVAQNKTIPSEILSILAKDEDEDVRLFVAQKRKLDMAVIKELAHDRSETVRQRIAYNPRTPREVLQSLAPDVSVIVSEVAQNRLGQLIH